MTSDNETTEASNTFILGNAQNLHRVLKDNNFIAKVHAITYCSRLYNIRLLPTVMGDIVPNSKLKIAQNYSSSKDPSTIRSCKWTEGQPC